MEASKDKLSRRRTRRHLGKRPLINESKESDLRIDLFILARFSKSNTNSPVWFYIADRLIPSSLFLSLQTSSGCSVFIQSVLFAYYRSTDRCDPIFEFLGKELMLQPRIRRSRILTQNIGCRKTGHWTVGFWDALVSFADVHSIVIFRHLLSKSLASDNPVSTIQLSNICYQM